MTRRLYPEGSREVEVTVVWRTMPPPVPPDKFARCQHQID